MIDLSNKKIAEILHYHITHESLDDFILNPVLEPYEKNEVIHGILATAVQDAGKEYFVQGYLLAKQSLTS